ncbi:MAG: hypothetical protein OXR66_02555 [Candidatus Woesearchaeota archaeon]|nr:hypothetical protein [Candidatus Woesearchaeota archaeon]
MITLPGVLVLLSCTSEESVRETIEEANYCDVTEDCVQATSACPFGCCTFVNKEEVENVNKKIEGFNGQCKVKCHECPPVACINTKCVQEV